MRSRAGLEPEAWKLEFNFQPEWTEMPFHLISLFHSLTLSTTRFLSPPLLICFAACLPRAASNTIPTTLSPFFSTFHLLLCSDMQLASKLIHPSDPSKHTHTPELPCFLARLFSNLSPCLIHISFPRSFLSAIPLHTTNTKCEMQILRDFWEPATCDRCPCDQLPMLSGFPSQFKQIHNHTFHLRRSFLRFLHTGAC